MILHETKGFCQTAYEVPLALLTMSCKIFSGACMIYEINLDFVGSIADIRVILC